LASRFLYDRPGDYGCRQGAQSLVYRGQRVYFDCISESRGHPDTRAIGCGDTDLVGLSIRKIPGSSNALNTLICELMYLECRKCRILAI